MAPHAEQVDTLLPAIRAVVDQLDGKGSRHALAACSKLTP
jgi:hypothetical protein